MTSLSSSSPSRQRADTICSVGLVALSAARREVVVALAQGGCPPGAVQPCALISAIHDWKGSIPDVHPLHRLIEQQPPLAHTDGMMECERSTWP